MEQKKKEKVRAVTLRKQGKTYGEILKKVPVSKSTLSLWLRDVGMAKRQKQILSIKKRSAQLKGAKRQHEIRLETEQRIKDEVKDDVGSISHRDLFLIGVALYWAEGSKIKKDRTGVMVEFSNSDPAMVKLFVRWLKEVCEISTKDIFFRLHLHKNHMYREKLIKKKWLSELSVASDSFTRTVYKKQTPKTNRRKTDEDYIGLVSVRVRKSTNLNRRIQGWVCGIIASQK